MKRETMIIHIDNMKEDEDMNEGRIATFINKIILVNLNEYGKVSEAKCFSVYYSAKVNEDGTEINEKENSKAIVNKLLEFGHKFKYYSLCEGPTEKNVSLEPYPYCNMVILCNTKDCKGCDARIDIKNIRINSMYKLNDFDGALDRECTTYYNFIYNSLIINGPKSNNCMVIRHIVDNVIVGVPYLDYGIMEHGGIHFTYKSVTSINYDEENTYVDLNKNIANESQTRDEESFYIEYTKDGEETFEGISITEEEIKSAHMLFRNQKLADAILPRCYDRIAIKQGDRVRTEFIRREIEDEEEESGLERAVKKAINAVDKVKTARETSKYTPGYMEGIAICMVPIRLTSSYRDDNDIKTKYVYSNTFYMSPKLCKRILDLDPSNYHESISEAIEDGTLQRMLLYNDRIVGKMLTRGFIDLGEEQEEMPSIKIKNIKYSDSKDNFFADPIAWYCDEQLRRDICAVLDKEENDNNAYFIINKMDNEFYQTYSYFRDKNSIKQEQSNRTILKSGEVLDITVTKIKKASWQHVKIIKEASLNYVPYYELSNDKELYYFRYQSDAGHNAALKENNALTVPTQIIQSARQIVQHVKDVTHYFDGITIGDISVKTITENIDNVILVRAISIRNDGDGLICITPSTMEIKDVNTGIYLSRNILSMYDAFIQLTN